MVTIAPKKIQYVIGSKGKPTGVLVDVKTWEVILEALEEADDVVLAREALAKLNSAGGNLEKAGFIPSGYPSLSQARASAQTPVSGGELSL
jgi:hypothetical protein